MASNARNLSKLLGTSTQVPTTALPPAIADLETIGQTLSGGEIAPSSIKSNTLTQSFDSNQAVTFNMADSIDAVSPIVSVFKEVPVTGVTSKGQWDVNANATNYEFFDEKSISYSSSTLTPSATGDGTFTSSTPTIIPNKFSLIPDFGTTQNTYATTGMSSYYINTSVNDGNSPQSSSVAVSPDGTKAIVLQWNTSSFGKQRLHSWNLQTAFGINSAYVWQAGTGYDPVNSQWLHQGYYDVTIGGTDVAHRHGHFGVDPSGVHFYFHRSTTTYYYKASTAWDVTTLSYQNKTFAPSGNGVPASNYNVQGAEISSNGSYLIYCSGNYVATYTMSTAFDVSTASSGSKQEVDVVSILTSAGLTVTGGLRSAMFNSDGTELLTNIHYSSHHHRAYKFTLSTAWDITTASYVQNSESSNGGYNLKFFEQSSSDNTWVSFTVDGSIDVAIVQLDEISQFNLNDVGKKVIGNSGSAIITGTSGTYTSVTPFADTSAISSWQLFGAQGKSDGTGIQLSGYGNTYDLSNLSYDSKSLTASSQQGGAQGMAISTDGTSVYTVGYTNDTVYQYTLTTAFDLSTASYANKSFSVASQDAVPRDIRFKPDGTIMYIIASTAPDSVYQYTLSTAWDVSTASYANKSLNVQSQSSNPAALVLSIDGTKVYVGGYSNKTVFQYNLSTAWDVSTGSYSNNSFATTTNFNYAHTALELNSDASKLFVGADGYLIAEYNMPSDGDVSNVSYIATYDVRDTTVGNKNIGGMAFANNGAKFYIYGNNDNNMYQFSAGSSVHPYSTYSPALTNSSNGQINSSSWLDINSMTADETKNGGDIFYAVSTDNRTSWGVAKASDGVRKIVKNNSGTWQYNNDAGTTVSVGYDLSNASYTTISPLLAQSEGYEYMHFKPDGTKVWVGGQNQDTIYEYDLSTGFDLSTISYGRSFAFSTSSQSRGFFMKSDGTRAYISDYTGTIYQLDLSTAWDITTASYSSVTLSLGHYTKDIYIKSDGTKLYNVNQNNEMKQFTMSTPWDLSTATLDHTVTLADSFTYGSITFNSDGTILFIAHVNTSPAALRAVNSYSLSTAWDISSTLTLITNYDIFPQIGGHIASGIDFNTDGSKMYIISAENTSTSPGRRILEYSTGGTNIGYATSETWVNGTNNNEHATLQEALGAQSFNRMNKAQLDAVADGYHFSQDSADTLDLMIAPYAASGTSPISDGVTINYDAEALIREAIPGTDYIAEFPNPNKLNITAVGAANLKIRAQ